MLYSPFSSNVNTRITHTHISLVICPQFTYSLHVLYHQKWVLEYVQYVITLLQALLCYYHNDNWSEPTCRKKFHTKFRGAYLIAKQLPLDIIANRHRIHIFHEDRRNWNLIWLFNYDCNSQWLLSEIATASIDFKISLAWVGIGKLLHQNNNDIQNCIHNG